MEERAAAKNGGSWNPRSWIFVVLGLSNSWSLARDPGASQRSEAWVKIVWNGNGMVSCEEPSLILYSLIPGASGTDMYIRLISDTQPTEKNSLSSGRGGK